LSFTTQPKFGIGQRAFLVNTPDGNILWDCITLLDDGAIQEIRKAGGIAAIAISHPHYYTTMVEWAAVFNAPVFLHDADRDWVMRPDERVVFWRGETKQLWRGATLIRGGGHFEGGTMLHWSAGAEGHGALFSGDIIQVVPDRRWVSFMYSYPNYIPLSAHAVERLTRAVEPFAFDRIYGAFPDMTVMRDGKGAVQRSAERYIRFLVS
jgi:glyoxylase-like metal-dependent hydrolase (beta-lactamase superfamily II)